MSTFVHSGYCDICEEAAVFRSEYDWFRDHLKCDRCGSIPRERALMQAIDTFAPDYQRLQIHESSPGGRGVSAKLSKACENYSYSQFFLDVALGSYHPERNERCESLERLTFDDNSFDLFITQDVMEHIMDPEAAFREIARVLKPDGAHIFTVPIVRKAAESRRRARLTDGGIVEHLEEPEYHGNPVDPEGSLVTMDWGYDILEYIQSTSGLGSQILMIDDIDRGIRAEFIEVVISRKR